MRTTALWSALLLTVAWAAAPSCALVLGDFDNGTGGKGTGTTATGPMCTDPKTDCDATNNDCVVPVCTQGTCATSNVADGMPVTMQVAGDCKQVVCDGAGSTRSANDDTDLPDDGNACTLDACSMGSSSNTAVAPAAKGQCMVDSMPGFCGDPAGPAAKTCVECNVGPDCSSGVCGANNKCLSAQCGDTVKNGDETDVDCGGSCGPCADTKSCLVAVDCLSKICDATALTCTAATCSDTVQNQGESDTDCGAVCAASNQLCAVGLKCGAAADCVDGVCDTVTTQTCLAATCSDGVKNQGESDADCGGTASCGKCVNTKTCTGADDCQSGFCDTAATPAVCAPCTTDPQCGAGLYCAAGVCAPTQMNGAPCVAGTQCTSTFCADGFCCDTDCAGTCLACNGTTKGTCSDVPSGTTDPGTCMGTSSCNGSGACLSNNGVACTMAAQCLSAHCVDGVCCNTTCGSACQSCTAALKGTGADGVCGATKAGGGSKGLCSAAAQSTCGLDGLCAAGGVCEKWPASTQCLAATCVGSVHKNASNCDGSGTCNAPVSQDCAPYACKAAGCPNTCVMDVDCTSGNWCDPSNHCVAKLGNGALCSGANQCTSNNCVDGFCCNTACNTTCMACNLGTPGTCSFVLANGTDNNPQCNGNSACDGAGACKVASGFPCTMNGQCASGTCKVGNTCQ
jgi:hypothetical protein